MVILHTLKLPVVAICKSRKGPRQWFLDEKSVDVCLSPVLLRLRSQRRWGGVDSKKVKNHVTARNLRVKILLIFSENIYFFF